MDALKAAKTLLTVLSGGPSLDALELADTVSGGHIRAAVQNSDKLFGEEVTRDTRDAALAGLDLARLNNSRFRLVLELLGHIVEVQEELTACWEKHPVETWPEERDLMAAASLVATGFSRQLNRGRRQLLVEALRGSLCPGPYMWGFQEEILKGLTSTPIVSADLGVLARLPKHMDIEKVATHPDIDSIERLALAGFASLQSRLPIDPARYGRSPDQYNRWSYVITQDRYSLPAGAVHVDAIPTQRGRNMLTMIKAGRELLR